MATKMDKEALVKNAFWIALGGAGLLLLVALVLLFLGPASRAAKAREEFAKFKQELASKKDLKNKSFLTSWEKRQREFGRHKEKVWDQAWRGQTDLMTWPYEMEALEKGYFGDKISERVLIDFKDTHYAKQFERAENFLTPRGGEAYLPFPFGDGSPRDQQRIFNRVAWQITPTVEEAWLAQEEIWLRRETINILRAALDSMAKCEEVREPLYTEALTVAGGGLLDQAVRNDPRTQAKLYKARPVAKELADQGVVLSRLFRNKNWELEVLIEKDPQNERRFRISPRSTIKNINPYGRSLPLVNAGEGLRFRIWQGRYMTWLQPIVGILMPAGGSTTFKVPSFPGLIDLRDPFEMEEVFLPATSPIRRLEVLEIGPTALSHRLAMTVKTVNSRISPKAEDLAAAASADSPSPPGAGPGGTPPGMGPAGAGIGPGGPGGAGQQAQDANLTPNQIRRNRYVLSNDQVRRVPIAFSIVLDQAYRNEVLAAVANSRLRIQTTQVYWAHRDDVPPATAGGGYGNLRPGGDWSRRPGSPMGGMGPDGMGPSPMGPGGLGPPPMGPGGMGPGGFGPPRPPSGPDDDGAGGLPGGGPPGFPMGGMGPGFPMGGMPGGAGQQDPAAEIAAQEVNRNLIGLSVHGIAALYERFPPRKPEAEGATPTTPSATSPGAPAAPPKAP